MPAGGRGGWLRAVGDNEGARIAAGHTGRPTWVQVGLNFVVPFLVSSYGYLAAARIPAVDPRAG